MANHCWHTSELQHMIRGHEDVICCFCSEEMCLTLEPERGHGDFAPIMYKRPTRMHMAGCFRPSQGRTAKRR